jgi:hypothetical protein
VAEGVGIEVWDDVITALFFRVYAILSARVGIYSKYKGVVHGTNT